MKPNRIAAVVLRQLYLIRGNPVRAVPLVAWAAIDIIVWGYMTRFLNTLPDTGFDFAMTLLGAILLWDFLIRVMHGVAMAFMEDSWSRNFINFFASPLTVPEYLTGLVVSSIGTSLVGLAAMLILASTVFGLPFFPYGLMTLPFLLTLFLFGIALGIFSNALLLRLGPSAEWFAWVIPALISPFAGVFYPLSTLPAWMQQVGQVLPPSFVFENLRTIVAGNPPSGTALVTGLALSVLYILLACGFFAYVYNRAIKTGLIARYSAENL